MRPEQLVMDMMPTMNEGPRHETTLGIIFDGWLFQKGSVTGAPFLDSPLVRVYRGPKAPGKPFFRLLGSQPTESSV